MTRHAADTRSLSANWPMLALLVTCYGLWTVATVLLPAWAAIPVLVLVLTLHASLSHEALHGHPTRSDMLNAVLVFPALGLAVPYLRFRDTHLAHHRDAVLTDPYDDPETNYLDPAIWWHLPRIVRGVLAVNNTLAGRILIGPAIGQALFMWSDLQAIRRGDMRVLASWLLHVPAVALVVWWLMAVGTLPAWAYLLAAYGAMGVLKVRTFLEHQAHHHVGGRTVVIEDRGLMALLFLNNNYHIVHHMHPDVPWHRLPALYFDNAARYLGRNHGYRYRNYAQIARRYLFRAKDSVPHPLWDGPDAPR
ncbi:fatty acid desaturase [Pseudaestuariivita atlantica]|uniref:Fatty acid desaturase n=1 Tax=Pseudaestuariivita atlantica TaxID=1317121 RepID=A0A0L1JVC7_9RHOB|nr:fatty acid desaturase [Pseudaestuariivita atlantica]KNG95348.1 fatty acid desaturase [Pseudaestuariivita atlantica]